MDAFNLKLGDVVSNEHSRYCWLYNPHVEAWMFHKVDAREGEDVWFTLTEITKFNCEIISNVLVTKTCAEDAETNEIVDIRLPDIFHEMYSKHSIAYRMHEKDQEIIKLFNLKALVESDKKFRTDIAYVDGVVESTSKTPDDEVDASKQQVLTRLREQLIKSEEEAGCLDDLSDSIGESNDKLRKENEELRERIAKLENFFNNVVRTATNALGSI